MGLCRISVRKIIIEDKIIFGGNDKIKFVSIIIEANKAILISIALPKGKQISICIINRKRINIIMILIFFTNIKIIESVNKTINTKWNCTDHKNIVSKVKLIRLN
jgi:hypothetical protein